MSPSDIIYSQNSIAPRFQDGEHLLFTFAMLVQGKETPQSLPPIEVRYMKSWESYIAFEGNRRLFLYKKLEEEGLIDKIPVVEFKGWKKQTSRCSDCITLRGYDDDTMERKMNGIINRYTRSYRRR